MQVSATTSGMQIAGFDLDEGIVSEHGVTKAGSSVESRQARECGTSLPGATLSGPADPGSCLDFPSCSPRAQRLTGVPSPPECAPRRRRLSKDELAA